MAPMSAAATSRPGESVGAPTRRRLAAFCRVLRQNGFKVGLAETRDALALLALPLAARPSALKPALRPLFCATHSGWDRFDDIFDAFWRGRGRRQTRTLTGSPTDGRAPLRRFADQVGPQGPAGLPDHCAPRAGRR